MHEPVSDNMWLRTPSAPQHTADYPRIQGGLPQGPSLRLQRPPALPSRAARIDLEHLAHVVHAALQAVDEALRVAPVAHRLRAHAARVDPVADGVALVVDRPEAAW